MSTSSYLNYYGLWKYFSDDAVKVKDKLWTIAVWLFALLGSVLSLVMNQVDERSSEFTFNHKYLVITSCAIGIALSIYA